MLVIFHPIDFLCAPCANMVQYSMYPCTAVPAIYIPCNKQPTYEEQSLTDSQSTSNHLQCGPSNSRVTPGGGGMGVSLHYRDHCKQKTCQFTEWEKLCMTR